MNQAESSNHSNCNRLQVAVSNEPLISVDERLPASSSLLAPSHQTVRYEQRNDSTNNSDEHAAKPANIPDNMDVYRAKAHVVLNQQRLAVVGREIRTLLAVFANKALEFWGKSRDMFDRHEPLLIQLGLFFTTMGELDLIQKRMTSLFRQQCALMREAGIKTES
ncbi:predicted protein [Phaeodactylum tricornutum CCAP 1055/1]|uniref:Uncharacterized protein n=1 Tax=Phaeodactylum tricornutum (strain CCAP 1055/1) TaxID=556484 RepID=B7FW56_PHATC|nr:predicted protein [Phaeodactylum tricornutum CCAP 1055/1]EEC49523.1 predicted protein [Phaeodactylum tricornutum CCAP 1055/1]|eukprot:XP_002178825.1 predicted protein [Phaeodactylum tricornutum CCAP 1055/1]